MTSIPWPAADSQQPYRMPVLTPNTQTTIHPPGLPRQESSGQRLYW